MGISNSHLPLLGCLYMRVIGYWSRQWRRPRLMNIPSTATWEGCLNWSVTDVSSMTVWQSQSNAYKRTSCGPRMNTTQGLHGVTNNCRNCFAAAGQVLRCDMDCKQRQRRNQFFLTLPKPGNAGSQLHGLQSYGDPSRLPHPSTPDQFSSAYEKHL